MKKKHERWRLRQKEEMMKKRRVRQRERELD